MQDSLRRNRFPVSVFAVLAALGVAVLGSPSIARAEGSSAVFFDLRPEQCPNRLYLGSLRGLESLPAAILGNDSLEATEVLRASLLLVVPGGGGLRDIAIPPIDTDLLDVATPVVDPADCNCTTAGPDIEIDVTMNFDAAAVLAALEYIYPGQVDPGVEFPLCITGTLLDGTPFLGCDCVLIDVPPLSIEPETWGRVKSIYR